MLPALAQPMAQMLQELETELEARYFRYRL